MNSKESSPVSELVAGKLRERAGFMREAGHNDDAELDEEAADRLTALEAENARLREALSAAGLSNAWIDKIAAPQRGDHGE